VRKKDNEIRQTAFAEIGRRPHPLPVTKSLTVPRPVDTTRAAEILGCSPSTLKRWRYEGVGPEWIELEGRVSYDLSALLQYIGSNTRTPSVTAVVQEARGIT